MPKPVGNLELVLYFLTGRYFGQHKDKAGKIGHSGQLEFSGEYC